MNVIRLSILMIVVPGAVCLTACRKDTSGPTATADPPVSFEVDPAERNALKTTPHDPVVGFDHVQSKPFFVTRRTAKITQFPCAVCHETPLTAPAPAEVVNRGMHVDIDLHHADSATMSCATCHNYADLSGLRLLGGDIIPFDASYRLCSQCHFEQAQDWAGGAHGKRLAGWQGKRVVMNCADCHNPHAPALGSHWPVQKPEIP